jgi:isopentenyl-diphosphate delta-isomerase
MNSPFKEEQVILVDERDNAIGTMGKMEAHQKGLLHRAFSVFIFTHEGQMLLQQRAQEKYHSGSLWTNACCSHPRAGETVEQAAERRLHEEMGLSCHLEHQFAFIYRAELDGDLIEHELDHVIFGTTDQKPVLNKKEAQSWRYIGLDELEQEITSDPDSFTSWFRICLPNVLEQVKRRA